MASRVLRFLLVESCRLLEGCSAVQGGVCPHGLCRGARGTCGKRGYFFFPDDMASLGVSQDLRTLLSLTPLLLDLLVGTVVPTDSVTVSCLCLLAAAFPVLAGCQGCVHTTLFMGRNTWGAGELCPSQLRCLLAFVPCRFSVYLTYLLPLVTKFVFEHRFWRLQGDLNVFHLAAPTRTPFPSKGTYTSSRDLDIYVLSGAHWSPHLPSPPVWRNPALPGTTPEASG